MADTPARERGLGDVTNRTTKPPGGAPAKPLGAGIVLQLVSEHSGYDTRKFGRDVRGDWICATRGKGSARLLHHDTFRYTDADNDDDDADKDNDGLHFVTGKARLTALKGQDALHCCLLS